MIEEGASAIAEYATIPIAYEIREVFEVDRDVTGRLTLDSRPAPNPVLKNYDALPGNDPLSWSRRFDITGWRFLLARLDSLLVGGAVMIIDAPQVELLEGRSDLALLWDIRVIPEMRRRGIGSAVLAACEDCARAHGAATIKVETQNVNVAACRFYSNHGYELRAANPSAYPTLPNETQLLWYKGVL